MIDANPGRGTGTREFNLCPALQKPAITTITFGAFGRIVKLCLIGLPIPSQDDKGESSYAYFCGLVTRCLGRFTKDRNRTFRT